MFIVVRWFLCVQLTIKWVLFHFYLKNIVDLIALKSILINRKPISQLNQHLSLFWKSCMEKSHALSALNDSENMICWLWPDSVRAFHRTTLSASAIIQLYFIINKIIVFMIIF